MMSLRVDILSQSIDDITLAEVLDHVSYIPAGRYEYCVTSNVDHLMKLRRDPEFRAAYAGAGLRVADGVPLVWASRFLGTPLRGRVNGTDLFERLAALAAERGWSIYLLGGADNSAALAAAVLERRLPGLRIAGAYAPAFGFEHDAEECRRIETMVRDARTDILFVGLGAPKQEKWLARHGAACNVRFAVGVGVSFSFVAGAIPRAPLWMQRNGLEWLWRLIQEPGRLWKRYLVAGLPFFGLVALQKLRSRRAT